MNFLYLATLIDESDISDENSMRNTRSKTRSMAYYAEYIEEIYSGFINSIEKSGMEKKKEIIETLRGIKEQYEKKSETDYSR